MTGQAGKRANLVSGLRARHKARRDAPSTAVRPAGANARVRAHDFSDMPDLKNLRMMETAAETFGLKTPFFRCHDGLPEAEQQINGAKAINFASYNYLGLNGDPRLAEAAKAAVDRWGVSPAASRVVGGERPYHRALEEKIAALYGVEDALVMVSGHATNVTTVGALMGPEDLVCLDALSHNSVVEGGRLSGAQRLNFPHNDIDWLDQHLARARHRYRHVLIAVEGLYSMDGDSPDLARLIEVKARHDAWLMVDEAHGLGVLGATGRGLAEAQGVDPEAVEIWMGTLSKTLGSCGGYIAGSKSLIEFLKYKAPGFVYSVGLAAPLAATASAAIDVMLAEPERVERLQRNGRLFREAVCEAGLDPGLSEGLAVTPVIIGDSMKSVALSHMLIEAGVNALPIIHPAVPEQAARLRFFITSEHRPDQLTLAAKETARLLADIEVLAAQLLG
ncbi:MAG: aminotransferase class I/II-fold pyridoxal phosphate-dependent enzyme [Pseudomonadota bacterium]